MSTVRERAKADYLEDPQIKEVIDSILRPHLSKKEATVAIQFAVPKDEEAEWSSAIAYASSLGTYNSKKVGRFTKHRVEFKAQDAGRLFEMYQQVENSPHLEIFIDEMKLPYAATLWLPLLWFYL